MKNFRLQTIALLLFVSAALTSCLNDDVPNEITLAEVRITAVNGPDVAAINTEISLTLTFNVDNDCGHFNRFLETKNENTTTIIGEAYYDSLNCNQALIQNTTYKFKETKAGTYTLKFKKSESEFITKTIVVS